MDAITSETFSSSATLNLPLLSPCQHQCVLKALTAVPEHNVFQGFSAGRKEESKSLMLKTPTGLPPWQWWKPAWLRWRASSICYAHTDAGAQEGSGSHGTWRQCRESAASVSNVQYGSVARGWSKPCPGLAQPEQTAECNCSSDKPS